MDRPSGLEKRRHTLESAESRSNNDRQKEALMSQDSRNPAPPGVAAVLVIASFAAVAVGFWWTRSSVTKPAEARSAPRATAPGRMERAAIGTITRLQSPQGEPIWIVVDSRAYQALRQAQAVRNQAAVAALFQSGQVFAVEEDTEARIVGEGGGFYQVRPLEGEHQGRTGWVPADHAAAVGRDRQM
jgi:hypothetical protein